MAKVPISYVPKYLNKKSKKKQKKELKKSRRAYKQKKYYTRKKIKGFKSKKSKWSSRMKKIYNLDITQPVSLSKLSSATKCKKSALNKIIKKGMGAYYSSGSRPNQTAHSWGKARLYSAVSGGPAAKVDYKQLLEGCSKSSKALKLAKKARVPKNKVKVRISGGGGLMSGGKNRFKERIVRFEKSKRKGKKYMAIVENRKTKKRRKLHFGAIGYQQFKDRTPLQLYKKGNHGTRKRMRNYFNRHSGTPIRKKAIEKEIRKSKGKYNPKILSHMYLW